MITTKIIDHLPQISITAIILGMVVMVLLVASTNILLLLPIILITIYYWIKELEVYVND